jgi:hypothetical protein
MKGPQPGPICGMCHASPQPQRDPVTTIWLCPPHQTAWQAQFAPILAKLVTSMADAGSLTGPRPPLRFADITQYEERPPLTEPDPVSSCGNTPPVPASNLTPGQFAAYIDTLTCVFCKHSHRNGSLCWHELDGITCGCDWNNL